MRSFLFIGMFAVVSCTFAPGCAFNNHGNRRPDNVIVTRFPELHEHVGRTVTLVGTARGNGADDAAIDLRGGSVEIPTYAWPPGYVGQPVQISGTLFENPAPAKGAQRVYRLGEIQTASKWSR